MERISINPRPDWKEKVEALGFGFHTMGDTYWDESAYYAFTMPEIDRIETATNTLWEMCLEAVQYVIDHNLYDNFAIPPWIRPHIEKTWNDDAPSIYGRFDFTFKDGVPKLLEFNADTPTSLFETGVVQWNWLEDRFPKADQFNSVHEKLIATWQYLKPYLYNDTLYFTVVRDSLEDITTVEYLRDCAIQAGLNTKFIYIDDIGWDGQNERFVDLNDDMMRNIFKLYPWEWLVNEAFGKNIVQDFTKAHWIEPSWKMILSNKAILPVLWQLFPNHENLLPAYYQHTGMQNYVKKPILSREGANIAIIKNGQNIQETDGEYGEEGYIYQEFCELPKFGDNYALVGSWVIGQEAAGIGIREAHNRITDNGSRYVPHLIV